MSSKLAKKVPVGIKKDTESFRANITKEAEELVTTFFPKKCLELDHYLNNTILNFDNVEKINSSLNLPIPAEPVAFEDGNNGSASKKRRLNDAGDAGSVAQAVDPVEKVTKVYLFPNGTVPCNQAILEIIAYIKPEVRTLVEKCIVVRMWVTLLIPKIEDGNNFGVQIQEETLGELRSVESETSSFLDQIVKYFLTRGQIVSKCAKYPNIGDFRMFISELDEKMVLTLRLIAAELRNHYSVLHDMILKNIDKITKPRNSNMSGMY